MKGVYSLFFTFLLIILVLMIGIIEFDKSDNNTLYISMFIEGDCDYKLPKGYLVVVDPVTGEYAISREGKYDNTYFELTRFVLIGNFTSEFAESKGATVFKDSCKVKGYAKKYFKSIQKTRNFIKLD